VPAAIGSTARMRARLAAERRLLAILCNDPVLASVQVSVEGCGNLPISEAIAPSEFADQGHSAIFAAIRDAAEEGRTLRFAALLSELAQPAQKRLASELYTFGEQLLSASSTRDATGGHRTAAEEVVVSWQDLENLERLARFRNPDHRASPQDRVADTDARGDGEERGAGSSPRGDASVDSNSDSQASVSQASVSKALERLARARERGHDATAASALFGRRSSPASEAGRSSNQ